METSEKKSRGKITGDSYPGSDPKLPKSHRIAHYLNWAADNIPYVFTQFNELLKRVEGRGRMPRLDSEDVNLLRRNVGSCKNILLQLYEREFISQPGVGVRASVDDTDRLKTVLPKRMNRFNAARKAAIQTASSIDLNNIPDTPLLKPYKDWMKRSVRDVIKDLSDPTFEKKLLPPLPTAEE